MTLRLKLKIVSTEHLERIHESTIQILGQTGVMFHSDEAVEIFKKNGARVDDRVVFISRTLLEQALESAPERFCWYARNEAQTVRIGPEQSRTHVLLDHGPIFIQDIETGRRYGNMCDLINLYRLGQASDIADIIGQIPIDPSDVTGDDKHLQIMYQLLKNTDKPLMAWPQRHERNQRVFEMVEIAADSPGLLSKHPAVGVSVCALSPLQFSTESCETIIDYAKKGQPLLILTCAMTGVTSPISLTTTAIQQNAEILAGIILAQLINPGTPVLYSPASAAPNLKTATYVTGAPESNLINMIGLQLANEMYHLPTRTMAGLTDAKVVDCQAGYETMQNYFTLMLSGTNLINECFGTLNGIMTVSYEKFMIDEEMISRMLCINEGINPAETDFDVDIINEVGHMGSFLMHPTTVMGCRNGWKPTVSNWDPFETWLQEGSQDVLVRANRHYKKVLSQCPDSVLDTEQDKALLRFMEKSARAVLPDY
jgi:trimethylamine--corrinoid protein Co-methyltransferase